MNSQHAFVVYANTSDSGRVFHALTYAKQAKARGDDAAVYFAGEGTGWPAQLSAAEHSMHSLFAELQGNQVIKGACENCANAFGKTDELRGICTLIHGPEESFGQIDILGLEAAGWRVWLF